MERIDWNLPLETDEPTPRKVVVKEPAGFPGYWCNVESLFGRDVRHVYLLDGTPAVSSGAVGPKIRNVRALRTSDECLQRMEAFVRRMADGWKAMGLTGPEVAEAREIVKLLPAPPVDPDLIEARKICECAVHWSPQTDRDIQSGRNDGSTEVKCALAGLKRGRELAHAEYTLGPPPGPNDDFLTYRRKLVVSERYEADSKPGGTRDLILMLIERETAGGPHRYRCDQNVRSLAESIARTLGMQL